MKVKIFILKLIFALILFSQNSFAKNLPPGSGISDVPANVLILLDKSGSMGARMISGSGFMYPLLLRQMLMETFMVVNIGHMELKN